MPRNHADMQRHYAIDPAGPTLEEGPSFLHLVDTVAIIELILIINYCCRLSYQKDHFTLHVNALKIQLKHVSSHIGLKKSFKNTRLVLKNMFNVSYVL